VPQAVPTVSEHLAVLHHSTMDDVLALRELILGSDPAIREAAKWNSPERGMVERPRDNLIAIIRAWLPHVPR
jgi:hypothetical protein